MSYDVLGSFETARLRPTKILCRSKRSRSSGDDEAGSSQKPPDFPQVYSDIIQRRKCRADVPVINAYGIERARRLVSQRYGVDRHGWHLIRPLVVLLCP